MAARRYRIRLLWMGYDNLDIVVSAGIIHCANWDEAMYELYVFNPHISFDNRIVRWDFRIAMNAPLIDVRG